MDVAEKMSFKVECRELFLKVARTKVYAVIKVENTIGGSVGYEHVGIRPYYAIVVFLPIGIAVDEKHRDTVEFQSFYLYAGVAEVMYIRVKSFDIGAI